MRHRGWRIRQIKSLEVLRKRLRCDEGVLVFRRPRSVIVPVQDQLNDSAHVVAEGIVVMVRKMRGIDRTCQPPMRKCRDQRD